MRSGTSGSCQNGDLFRFIQNIPCRFHRLELSGDREHWHAAAMAVVETIDQMQVAWTATPRADGQLSRQMGFGAGCECRCFFMPYMNPLHLFLFAYRIRNSI